MSVQYYTWPMWSQEEKFPERCFIGIREKGQMTRDEMKVLYKEFMEDMPKICKICKPDEHKTYGYSVCCSFSLLHDS